MASLQLRWLGPPEVERDGQPLRLEMRKTLALLAYLSLTAQDTPREILAALFWPEYDQQHALASLRRNLSSLTRSLPSGLLQADRETIGLRKVDWLAVDVDQFHEQLSHVFRHSHLANVVCPDCLVSLEKAVATYRGGFFEGFSLKDCPEFDEWQLFQREALQSEYAGAIEKLAGHYASKGQWDKAISHARAWMALDRLNEPAQRMLISLLIRSGQRRAAQRQYEDLVRQLQAELAQEPEDETTRLMEGLGSDAPELQRTPSKPLIAESARTRGLEPVLKTKLYIPFSKARMVMREKSSRKLDQVREHALAILSAPAGFGKTTALTEWIRHSPLAVAWLSLDSADNNPVRFLSYLIAATQEVEAGIGGEALALLQSSPAPPSRTIVASLAHDCQKVSTPFVLVLDDYHVIHEAQIHDAVSRLLDWLPGHMHMVISSRSDPPLAMARLRAQGKLLEVRAQDLRFTTREILTFFNEIMGLQVSSEDVALLDERTEGWAAGLQMAALSLRESPDQSKAIRAFTGSNRYVLDYFLEEVLERQPTYVQDFLLQTSILEEMNGSLCDAVTGIREWSLPDQLSISPSKLPLTSQQILEYLERSNLFVQSLDDERCWYRYHHLFAELLHARLRHTYPDRIETLHVRASQWHERNGSIPAAARHALVSRSFAYAAGAIERAIRTNLVWGSGDLALLLSWVEALPTEVLLANPLLRLELCAAHYVTGDFKKSSRILEALGDSLPEVLKASSNPGLAEELFLIFRVLHDATLGNISKAVEGVSRARALKTGDQMADLLSRNYLLFAYVVAGDLEKALSMAHPSFEELISRGYSLQGLGNAKNVADAYILQGRLKDAIELCRQAIELCKLGGVRSPVAGMVGFPIGAVWLERNELQLAEAYAQEALDLCALGPIGNDFGMGYALLAWIKQAQGDRERALQLIEKALQIAEFAAIPRIVHMIHAYRARIWLAQGKVDLASSWAVAYRLLGPTEYPREFEDLTLVQVLIQQRQYTEAHLLLDKLRINAHAAGRYGRVIEILILLAVVHCSEGRTDEALALLEETLRAARQEGYARAYLDQGEPMRALIRLYRDTHGMESKRIQPGENELLDYVDKLLLAFEGGSPQQQ